MLESVSPWTVDLSSFSLTDFVEVSVLSRAITCSGMQCAVTLPALSPLAEGRY